MTPDQLRQLGDAYKSSAKDADAYLDTIIASRPGSGVAVKGKTTCLYLVERPGPDVGKDTLTGDRRQHLGELMRLAGFSAELRTLIKACERSPAADAHERVPTEDWVVEAARQTKDPQPDVQALACMRLQVNVPFLHDKPWVRRLALRRLSQLLVEFPALMHPRLAFEWNRVSSGMDRDPTGPHFMAMFFAKCPGALTAMPIPQHGVTLEQIEAFAAHPVVAAGIRAREPIITDPNFSNAAAQGFTMMESLTRMGGSRPGLLASMLLLDRLRQNRCSKKAKGASLFSGRGGDGSGVLDLIGVASARVWAKGDSEASRLYRDLLASELRKSPTFPPGAATLNAILWHADHLFHEKGRTAGMKFVPSPDPESRLERLRKFLVDAGSTQDESEASVEVMKAAFPEPGEGHSFSASVELVSVSTANRMIASWLSAGVSLDALQARLNRYQASADSSWIQALQVFINEKSMRETIDAATSAAAVEAAAAAADATDAPDAGLASSPSVRSRRTRLL